MIYLFGLLFPCGQLSSFNIIIIDIIYNIQQRKEYKIKKVTKQKIKFEINKNRNERIRK